MSSFASIWLIAGLFAILVVFLVETDSRSDHMPDLTLEIAVIAVIVVLISLTAPPLAWWLIYKEYKERPHDPDGW